MKKNVILIVLAVFVLLSSNVYGQKRDRNGSAAFFVLANLEDSQWSMLFEPMYVSEDKESSVVIMLKCVDNSKAKPLYDENGKMYKGVVTIYFVEMLMASYNNNMRVIGTKTFTSKGKPIGINTDVSEWMTIGEGTLFEKAKSHVEGMKINWWANRDYFNNTRPANIPIP